MIALCICHTAVTGFSLYKLYKFKTFICALPSSSIQFNLVHFDTDFEEICYLLCDGCYENELFGCSFNEAMLPELKFLSELSVILTT
jgi:hypothetical protein